MASNRTSQEERAGIHLIDCSDDDLVAGYKACKQCGMLQPLDAYSAEAKGVGGRKAICRACSDDFGAGYKACKQCGMIQPHSAYRVEARGVGGRKAICRACSSERTI